MSGIKYLFDLVDRISALPEDVQRRCSNIFAVHGVSNADELEKIEQTLGVKFEPSSSDPRRMCLARNVGESSITIYCHTDFNMMETDTIKDIVIDTVNTLTDQGLTVEQVREKLNAIPF